MFLQNKKEGLLATLSVYRRWLTLLLVVVGVMTYFNILYSEKDAILFEKTKEEVKITQGMDFYCIKMIVERLHIYAVIVLFSPLLYIYIYIIFQTPRKIKLPI